MSQARRNDCIQWLLRAVAEFKIEFETFLLAVHIFDSFVSTTKSAVADRHAKKVIAAAFLIAAKKVRPFDSQVPSSLVAGVPGTELSG